MTNFSHLTTIQMDGQLGYYELSQMKSPLNNSLQETFYYKLERMFFSVFIFFICIFGLLGNGTVFCLLGFYIRKNCFATYILNMAVADSGVLVCLVSFLTVGLSAEDSSMPLIIFQIALELFLLMYSVGQLLLTAISIDGSTSAFFSAWPQCHWPSRFSTIVCSAIWFFSLLIAIMVVVLQVEFYPRMYYQFIVSVILCLPIMIICSVNIFAQVYLKPRLQQKKKFLRAIFLILLFSLLFDFPLNAWYISYFPVPNAHHMELRAFCASVHSSVKPVIYFWVGKEKTGWESIKVILQRVFKEEEDCREDMEFPVHS